LSLLTDLIAAWELDEASGNALDAHAGLDLTETSGTIGASSGPGGVGGSRDFEAGDTEYFAIADNADLSVGDIDWTIEAWVNLESKPAGNSVIAAKWDSGSNQREYMLLHLASADRFQFLVSQNGTTVNTASADTLGSPSLSTWYQLLAWHDSVANTLNIQVNNGAVDSVSYSSGGRNGPTAFQIGASLSLGVAAGYLDGLAAKVRLWKRVLTSDERAALYNSGNGLAYPLTVATGGNRRRRMLLCGRAA
jgi:hypothetical protein